MNTLEKFREKKDGILDDMRSYISYQPSRDNDLLAFMEQYLKSDSEHRPALLVHLRDCMDGKSYPNPYEKSYHYTQNDVERCEKILKRYLDCLLDCQGESDRIADCVRQATCEINALNKQCGGALVDNWRRERLSSFLRDTASQAGMEAAESLTFEQQMW